MSATATERLRTEQPSTLHGGVSIVRRHLSATGPIIWSELALGVLAVGFIRWMVTGSGLGDWFLTTALAVAAVPIVIDTIRDARRGHFATDIVATLAIVGSLVLGHPIAGLVVVMMKQGGEALERYAHSRASMAVRALEEAAPRIAHRIQGTEVVDVAASSVAVGDLLLIRPGDLVPCDGIVEKGESDLDTSSLTGEMVPRNAGPGVAVMSGSANGSGVLELRATALAARSQYAQIVELVRSAQSHKAPLQRLADRYAVWFTPLILVVCAISFVVSHDWVRVLAILVVATPCPLLLATPIAFVGGINTAARRHVIVRDGGALERLAAVTTVVFDKTGTITVGAPRVVDVQSVAGRTRTEILRAAAAVEQGSGHRLARVVVDAARSEDIAIPSAHSLREKPGQGIIGVVDDQTVRVGSRDFVLAVCTANPEHLEQMEMRPVPLRSYVCIGGRFAGVIEYADELRPELVGLLGSLRRLGVPRIILLSGDHAANAAMMAARAGIPEVFGDMLPGQKAAFVRTLRQRGEVVLMVGDGTNDAPALATADVGIALAGHGGGVTAEAADVVVLNDELHGVRDALRIGRRTMRIARQSLGVGLGLSAAAMIWAAFGGIQPVAGALLQEAIDVAVILNALRTIRTLS